MTRTAGAPIGCQRPSRFWGLGCPKIYHEAEDTLDIPLPPEADDVLFTRLWPAAEHFLKSFDIEFCILQAGADSIGGDPITHLNLSPRTHAAVARALSSLPCQRLLVLRGGGYNRHNLAQAWNDVVQALSA
ncbi:hypothetical protein [Thiolapillus sp.]|uniref:hypothetical protein n=1 Tax=Thiolapillus sp. TaxID=2017437 RepID=UPI003AF68EA1